MMIVDKDGAHIVRQLHVSVSITQEVAVGPHACRMLQGYV
jgi:hypothetical protein